MAVPCQTRVLLADQPGFSRTALARMLADTPGVTLAGKVSEVEGIAAAVEELEPDVLVVDDRLVRDGHAPASGGVRLIVVGVDDDPGFAARAQRIGAEAWVPKERADSLLPLLLTR